MGLKGLDDKDDEDKKDDDDDGKKDDKKKLSEEEASLPAKVFVFYLKTYDCAKSKVYKEFATNYKNNSLITSDVDEDVDDKWLKKLAKKDIDVDDPDKASGETIISFLVDLHPNFSFDTQLELTKLIRSWQN